MLLKGTVARAWDWLKIVLLDRSFRGDDDDQFLISFTVRIHIWIIHFRFSHLPYFLKYIHNVRFLQYYFTYINYPLVCVVGYSPGNKFCCYRMAFPTQLEPPPPPPIRPLPPDLIQIQIIRIDGNQKATYANWYAIFANLIHYFFQSDTPF